MSKIPSSEFDSAVTETVSFKVTIKELGNISAVAKSCDISVSELMRNLVKDHVFSYSLSENLSKNLQISGKIDTILLERRLISSRKVSNLSKMRELLIDFEHILEEDKRKIDWKELVYFKRQLDELIKIIYEKDEWLANSIDAQWYKITMHKHIIYAEKMKNI